MLLHLNSFTSNGRKNFDVVSDSFYAVMEVQQEVLGVDMEVFLETYVSSFIARQLLCCINCNACEACLTSQVIIPTNMSPTYSKKLVLL
jgi:hypothetical protein